MLNTIRAVPIHLLDYMKIVASLSSLSMKCSQIPLTLEYCDVLHSGSGKALNKVYPNVTRPK